MRFGNDLAIGEDQAFIFTYAMHIRSIDSIEDHLYNVDVSDGNSLSRKARPYLTEQLMEVNRPDVCGVSGCPACAGSGEALRSGALLDDIPQRLFQLQRAAEI